MKKAFNKKNIAQAATELAIFGAVLIFLIGGLIRVGFQQSMSMNQQLRAMRMALSESWRTAQGEYSAGKPSIARSMANILVVEDRLSVDAGQKFGTRDRVPYMAMGGGTFTMNLLYSFDLWSTRDLPVFDIFVNGQRFPLTTAGFQAVNPLPWPANKCRDAAGKFLPHPDDSRCVEDQCVPNPAWHPWSPPGTPTTLPCVVYFRRIYSGAGYDDMELLGDIPSYASAPDRFRLRFYLDFKGDIEDRFNDPNDLGRLLSKDFRRTFSWQWVPLPGVASCGDLTAEVKAWTDECLGVVDKESDPEKRVDIDGDFEMETIFKTAKSGVFITSATYLDGGSGDIDVNYEPKGVEEAYGLQADSQMYSYTRAGPKWGTGTYYKIEQGRILSLNGQFIRNTNRNDHVDLIMRRLRLKNNTQRFCVCTGPGGSCSAAAPRVWGGADCSDYSLCNMPPNPVEACIPVGASACQNTAGDEDVSCCFSQANIEKTCMDLNTNTIYIRSLLKNITGTRWTTRIDVK